MKKIPVKRTLPGNKRTPSNTTPTPKRPSQDLTPTGKPDSAPYDTRADAAATVMSTGEMVHDKTGEVLPKAKAAAQHTVRVETPLKVKTLHTIKVQASPQLARAAGRGRPGPDGLQPQKGGSTTEDSQDTKSATIVLPDAGTAASFRVFVPESGTVASSHGETASVDFPETAVDAGTVVSCASVSPEPGAGSRSDWSPPDAGPEGHILETGTAAVAHDVEPEVVGTSMQDLRAGLMRNMGAGLAVEEESGTAVAQDLRARVVGDFGMDTAATVNGGTSMYDTVAGGDVGKVVGSLGGVGGGYGAHMAMWTPLCLEALDAPFSAFVNPEQAGYVGFANLPNQVHRKSVKKGFEFTLMVVGESGLGKSTLVNSLFLTDLYPERHVPTASEKIQQTVKIDASTVEIEERGVKLRLTVVDTPGFGDSLNSTDCFRSIIRYIDDQFERYLQDESGLNRRHIIDNRVHCCFYFINPSGHGLKPLDVAFMRTVHHKVNIVPVLAKADTLTKLEVTNLKRKILDQIEDYGIKIYPLPDCDSDEDEDYKEQCRQLKNAVPFAVVGANAIIEVKGRKVRGRMYPWGVVEVENPEHCDFIKLRTMLITHMQDLQEVTQETHYENYRAEKLANGGAAPPKPSKSAPPPSQHDGVTDRERELMQKEEELRKMQEKLARMQAEIDMKRPAQQANGNIRTHDL